MDEKIRAITYEQIENVYRRGMITAEQRRKLVMRKAKDKFDEDFELLFGNDSGFFKDMAHEWLAQVNESWQSIVDIATTKRDNPKEELKAAGRVLWDQVSILFAPMAALGHGSGKKAQDIALELGASPGLSAVIATITDFGITAAVPSGSASKSFVKGVQQTAQGRVGKALFGGGAVKETQIAKTTKSAKAAGQAMKETDETLAKIDAILDDALGQGLKKEGVTGQQLAKVGLKEGVEALPKAVEKALPDASDDFLKSLRQFRQDMGKITETKAHETTLKEAEKLGLTVDDLLAMEPGTALKEAEMAAYLKALDGPVDDLLTRAKAFVEGQIAPEEFTGPLQKFFQYGPKFRGAEVTAGRSVEILKETPPMKSLTNMLVGWDPDAMARGDRLAAIRTIAEDIVAMGEDATKLKTLQVTSKGMLARIGEEYWPMAREAYINLLLARPITHIRNFAGNAFANTYSTVERQLAGWLSIDDAKGVANNEGVYMARGMVAALADGIKAFAQAYKSVGPDEVTRLDFIPHKIPGGIGRIINLPADTLRGMDNFFKTITRRGSYYAEALRTATQRGFKGRERANFIVARANNPTEAMIQAGDRLALTNTFQNDLGTIGKAAQKGLQAGPLALWFPFMKTPINLAKYAWNRAPGLQLVSKSLYEDILAGGVKADEAIARLTMGNMMGAFVYGLAQEGLITGGGPTDPALRRTWMADHQPYSIRTKEGWIPIANAEPGSTLVGLVADFAEVVNQLDDPTAEQTAMAVALAASRGLVDKTYWRTMGDLVDLVSAVRTGEEPKGIAMRVARGPLVTTVTGGPLGASVARSQDPVLRETRGFMDDVRARVPGYSKTVPPRRDILGDPVIPPQPLGKAWVERHLGSTAATAFSTAMPLLERPEETDPLKIEASKLQIRAPYFPWNIGGRMRDDFDIRAPMPGDRLPVELDAKQRDRWQELYRAQLRDPKIGLETMVLNNPEYKKRNEAFKREMFMDALAEYRSNARDQLLVEDKGLAEKMIRSEASQYLPMLEADEKARAEAAISQTIDLLGTLDQSQQQNLLRWGEIGEEEAPE